MNTAQKVISALGLCVTLYFALTLTVGKNVPHVTVKYQNRLLVVPCQSTDEQRNLILKSNNDVLFFDGEYFYDDVPSNPESNRAKIINYYDKVVGGDMHFGGYLAAIFTCLLITGLAMAFASADGVGGYDDYY